MATKAQVKANRQNAKKSTGPRTEDGKASTSQNALKHGLLARDAVLPGEDPADFDRHFQTFEDTIEPQNALEFALVRQIADAEWRLRRLARIETAFLAEACDRTLRAKQNHHPDRVPTDYEGETLLIGEALRERSQDQVNFARYKSHLCRDLNRAVTLIRTLRRDEYACNENLSRKTGRRRLPKVTFPEPRDHAYPNPYDDPHRHNEPNRYDPPAADQPNRPAARIGFRPNAQPTNEPLVAQVPRPAVSALLPTQSSACGPVPPETRPPKHATRSLPVLPTRSAGLAETRGFSARNTPPETRDTPPCSGVRLPAASVCAPPTVHGSGLTVHENAAHDSRKRKQTQSRRTYLESMAWRPATAASTVLASPANACHQSSESYKPLQISYAYVDRL